MVFQCNYLELDELLAREETVCGGEKMCRRDLPVGHATREIPPPHFEARNQTSLEPSSD